MPGAGKWKMYDQAKLELGEAILDLTTGSYKMALFTAASNANTLSGNSALGDLTNEVANGNGYTTGGVALSAVTWQDSGGIETFTSGNGVWTASGTGITARFAVIYKVGTFTGIISPLICVCLLDTTPADVVIPAGQQFIVVIAVSGILQLSGAASD